VKREQANLGKAPAYAKELLLCKQYLEYREVVVVEFTQGLAAEVFREHAKHVSSRRVNFRLHPRYLHLLEKPKLKGLVYVIEDLHLGQEHIGRLKGFIQGNQHETKVLLMTRPCEHRQGLKQHITIRLSDLEVEDIFRHQTKESITEVIQDKSKKLWEHGFFGSQEEFQRFLLATSLKLPLQYYKKHYGRQCLQFKFRPQLSSLQIIKENEEVLRTLVDISPNKCYLSTKKEQHLEISSSEALKKMEKVVGTAGQLEKIIIGEIYRELVPYCLADKVYIIQEDIQVLPSLVSAIQDRKMHELSC
jgi:hypothetical protein